MKVYTKTGDSGTTSLVGGTRVSKSSPRLDAYGTADELNSHLGLLIAIMERDGAATDNTAFLQHIQHKIFNLGSELAAEPGCPYPIVGIADSDAAEIEGEIDRIEALLPVHRRFILPGGTVAAAQANVARTVARRCERRMVAMTEDGMPVAPAAMKFVNRLSDYLFVLSRLLNVGTGADEIFWDKEA